MSYGTLRCLIADDTFAASFQTLRQYRNALLVHVSESEHSTTEQPQDRNPFSEDVLGQINTAMNGSTDCRTFRLGECAMIDRLSRTCEGRQTYVAALYLWDPEFNDSTAIAKWFADAGAESITIRHTLYDEFNGDRDGKTDDGAREIDVMFAMKKAETQNE